MHELADALLGEEGQDGADNGAGWARGQALQDGQHLLRRHRALLVQAPLLPVQGVRIHGRHRLADGIGEEQLGGGQVALPGPLQQLVGHGLDVRLGDPLAEDLAQPGRAAGEGVAGTAGIAPGKAAVGVPAVATARGRGRARRRGADIPLW
jgi:hypothetical protein